MCQLTKKLALFNYMIDKWAELQARKDNPTMQVITFKAKNAAIQKFSTTRFMKLAYFTCLESARGENNSYKSDNLFKYFNNWIAYDNGPVEQTIYDHKGQMLTISKNENFEYKTDKTEEDLKTLLDNEDLSVYKKMIDESIYSLTHYNNTDKSIPYDANADDSIGKLIWISHGELWNLAQWANNKKMDVDVEYFVNMELAEFDKRKEHLMVDYKSAA
ncbi:hypothetical protein FACS189413_13580 [Bacteroidia bacterium]|nr:hypothetical protein FACS189413_13580 [Bacteroidia bacterium]